jgi:hypothetical protein
MLLIKAKSLFYKELKVIHFIIVHFIVIIPYENVESITV